ncbi:hypothetical protein [Nocardioides sp. zg-DK7169]|uniref:hypothetical protein n=1 Tax=Nocardioides sp. zg-DK7169 TaxID=2736600 RepID=UPI00155236BB|nr:hypothetical protein [Nocardioides sp. zg-DK7169]NPC95700.1 hypothetical protein [Nocardioides sp. zg-DK7169]
MSSLPPAPQPREDEPLDAPTWSVGGLAAALREDPVIVQEIMGNGQRDAVDDALTELIDGADFPVYVALVQRPGGLADDQPEEELASLLHAEIGEDGLYVVAVDTVVGHLGWQTYGAEVPGKWDIYAVNAAPENGERTSSAAGEAAELVATALNDAEPLPGDQVAEYRTGDLWVDRGSTLSEDISAPTEGTYAVVATGLGVGVAILAWFVLRTIARWRELAPATPVAAGVPRGTTPGAGPANRAAPAVHDVRRRAEKDLADLDRALLRRSVTVSPALTDPAREQRLDGSRTAARTLLDSSADDEADLLATLGALVLVRTARRALEDPETPYRPCFLNPWHGEASARVTAAGGGDQVEVPVCERCRRAQSRPELADPLQVRTRFRRLRPYWEGDDVWARTGFGAISDDLWRAVLEDRQAAR